MGVRRAGRVTEAIPENTVYLTHSHSTCKKLQATAGNKETPKQGFCSLANDMNNDNRRNGG